MYVDGTYSNYHALPGYDASQDWQSRVLEQTFVGADNGGSVNFLDGSIGEILIYNRELTLAERQAVGCSGKSVRTRNHC